VGTAAVIDQVDEACAAFPDDPLPSFCVEPVFFKDGEHGELGLNRVDAV
jgi:hypothetical protein